MKKELILKKATFNIKLKILEILFEKVWGGVYADGLISMGANMW